jgi:hypothetical protein
MQSGANIYDGYINDSDFIGTSFPTAPDGKLYQLLVQQFATFTGSVRIGSPIRKTWPSSKLNLAMN